MLTATPAQTPTIRRRHGSSDTRQRILEVSLHLFSTTGFPRTTVRDIARAAGISDAAIYYHFTTKEDLLHELLDARVQPDRGSTERMQDTSIRELIREAMRDATRVIDGNYELLMIIFREGLAGDPAAACRYGQLLDGWESRLVSRLLPFEATGALASGGASRLARQTIYTIIMAFEDMLLLRPDRSVSPEERRQQTQSFLGRHIDFLLPSTCDAQALAGRVAIDPATGGECLEDGP